MEVKKFLNKDIREKQKLMASFTNKQALKRQNLYVSNFPLNWTEENISQIFSQYGQIESIKLENANPKSPYAFV